MPPPALRCSPGKDQRAEYHKRRRSFESGLLSRDPDEGLALFSDLQSREKDDFLLRSNDDFEDTFSTKLRYFSDNKLGVSVSTRGESSDLLNVDGEKNDYEWLITPPDTPLFRSLDDEAPPVNLAQRGRPRSQPISISRSSTMEKSNRSSRGSASPNRLSPSPRSGNSTFQSRGRSSSATSYSPPATVRQATPSRRPSSPSKPATPAQRSSTPTPRRISTGSSGTVGSSAARGVSPSRTSRGNSSSPKVRAWQSNIPGFSTEAPPNLRTSLADRPARYVRGSSPASRNGADSSLKSQRQSMSPTASRSISSSHSNDRDPFTSRSKGSVGSYGVDDLDSLPSIAANSSEHSVSRRGSVFPNNRAPISKKSSRTVSSSYAPKRSFDLALRQADNRKVPQNMFRPLLSSVPSSTFYAGKASATHHAMASSVTTSSNASSDIGTSDAHDNEGSESNLDDVTSRFVKQSDCSGEDEVFVFDKTDTSDDDLRQRVYNNLSNSQLGVLNEALKFTSQLSETENIGHLDIATRVPENSVGLDMRDAFSDFDGPNGSLLCSGCGCWYTPIESMDYDLKLCPECSKSYSPLTHSTHVAVSSTLEKFPTNTVLKTESESFERLGPQESFLRSPAVSSVSETRCVNREDNSRDGQSSYSEPIWDFLSENSLNRPMFEEGEESFASHEVIRHSSENLNISENETGNELMQHSEGDFPKVKLDVLEGAGISILLRKSSSFKGHVVRSRNFSASSISYDDLSYMRDSTNSMRSSTARGSVSASSSVDWGSAKQTDTRLQRQSSGRKSGIENYRYDMNGKHLDSASSLSGTSSQAFPHLSLGTNTQESFEASVDHLRRDAAGAACIAPQEQLSGNLETSGTCFKSESGIEGGVEITSVSGLSLQIPENLDERSSSPNTEEPALDESFEESTGNTRNMSDVKASDVVLEPSDVKDAQSPVDEVDSSELPAQSSLVTISEIDVEVENNYPCSPGSEYSSDSPRSERSIDEPRQLPVPPALAESIADSVEESNALDQNPGINEKQLVTVECEGRVKVRSLTLEEATETILFCSSIVQDLAYSAATIAIEKECPVPSENSWRLVPTTGKANSERKELRSRNASKRTSKSPKVRQKKTETNAKPPIKNKDNERSGLPKSRIVGVANDDDNTKPPKLESKCNCTIM